MPITARIPPEIRQKAYMSGTFKSLLEDEMDKYLDTVNYLVVNLVDYRNADTYSRDMAYYDQGLAADNIYLNVLARSRFFCAHIMEIYEDDFGLYGAIVIPYDLYRWRRYKINVSGIFHFFR